MKSERIAGLLLKKQIAERNRTVREMRLRGFKLVPDYPELLINETADVYNLEKRRFEKLDSKNRIRVAGATKYLSVPKLLLLVFRFVPYREGQHVGYLDGNSKNLCPSNVKYTRLFDKGLKIELNTANLIKAIRCYNQIEKNFQIKNNILARTYLGQIVYKRGILIHPSDPENLKVVETYLEWSTTGIQATAKIHNMSALDCTVIIYSFLNKLSGEILEDLKRGKLSVLDYLPRPKTKTQAIREYNELKKDLGSAPIPLRAQSKKKMVQDFEKRNSELLKAKDR